MQAVPNSALLFLCWLLKKISFFRSFSLTKICAFSLLWSRTRVCAASLRKNTNFFFRKKCHKTFFWSPNISSFFSLRISTKEWDLVSDISTQIHVTSSELKQHVFCIYKSQVFSQPEVKLLLFLNLSLSRAIMHQGGNSQNFLKQSCKIFVTLGLKILRLLRLKVYFWSRYH